ncbi:uncharacterized protein LOC110040385 isoform X2 [Orbicella faveolata]|uniref:uncharacterized protein LOC110040385 isoform X2 n=1 Tax=Orbicella faveolata TaxID=48498 RepID=UPI0009E1E90E|nr:uncharacterized protein LOC110040385 isoform X2 [Orbicella faveolata]
MSPLCLCSLQLKTMQLRATCLLLFTITAGSAGRLFRRAETNDEQNTVDMSLKDLAEAENPINMRGYSGVCNVNYVKIGCFKDKKNDRALSQELFQDLSSGDPNYSGENVDWSDYSIYLRGLACRCAESSQQNGFTYFGLQDYGRCFSAPHAASSYNMHGSSNRCSNQHYQSCDDHAWGECVGKAKDVNYVYEIVEASSADGEISYGKPAYDQKDYETQNREN